MNLRSIILNFYLQRLYIFSRKIKELLQLYYMQATDLPSVYSRGVERIAYFSKNESPFLISEVHITVYIQEFYLFRTANHTNL